MTADDQEMSDRFEAMMQLSEGFEQMATMGASYRVKLEAAGFSPAMAEQIAAHFLMEQQAKLMRETA